MAHYRIQIMVTGYKLQLIEVEYYVTNGPHKNHNPSYRTKNMSNSDSSNILIQTQDFNFMIVVSVLPFHLWS